MSKQFHPNLRSRAILGKVIKQFGKEKIGILLARLLYHLTIEGEELIPLSGPSIIPFNHISHIADSLCFLVIYRRRKNVYLFGAEYSGGFNPVERFLLDMGENDTASRVLRAYKAKGMAAGELIRSRNLLRQGKVIMIAAEGNHSWHGRFQHPLTPGTAWMALQTAAPVIPVVSIGGYTVQPRWDNRIWLTGRIKVRVGQPFTVCDSPITKISDDILEKTNQLIWDRMNSLING